jgi:hypothetical protein
MTLSERIFNNKLNDAIVTLQNKLSAAYGWDSAIVVETVRKATAEAKATKNLDVINRYMN